MRTPTFCKSLAVIVLITVGAGAAEAQQPPLGGINQSRRPVFSPYLNLLRTENDAAVNYYGLVRPQFDFRRALQQVEQEESSLEAGQRQIRDAATGQALPATGHASGFLNQGRYFMNRSGAGGAARQGGGGTAVARPTLGTAAPGLGTGR
jgi:hypothetical protein